MSRKSSRCRGSVARYALLAMVAIAGLGGWLYLSSRKDTDRKKPKRSGGSALKVAGAVPESCAFVVAVENPGRFISEARSQAEKIIDATEGEDSGKEWAAARKECLKSLGFDFADPGSYSRAGFDLTSPASLTVLELDERGEPAGIVISTGVSDTSAALATARRIAESDRQKLKKLPGRPAIHAARKEFAAAIDNDRLFLLFCPRKSDPAKVLRRFLDERKSRPLGRTSAFRTALGELPGQDRIRAYLNLKSILAKAPIELTDFAGLALSSGGDRLSAFLQLAEGAEIRTLLEAGAESRDFLAGMDKPMAAFTLSLRDPVGLLTYLIELSDGDLAAFDRSLNDSLGLSLDELTGLFRNGTGGIALYPVTGQFIPVGLLGFVKTNDRTRTASALESLMLQGGAQRTDHGDNVVYTIGGFIQASAGLVDEYAVFGNATEQIARLAAGEGEGWKPSCGGSELIAADFFADEFMESILAASSPKDRAISEQFFGEGKLTRLTATCTRRGDGVLCVVEGNRLGPVLTGALGAATFTMIRVRRKALRTECAYSMYLIAQALGQYSVDFDQECPGRLEDLYNQYIPDTRIMCCPESEESGSYVYVSGLRYTDQPGYIILLDAEGAHGGEGLNVIYLDGRVKWRASRAEVERQLAQQRQELGAAGRTMTLIPVSIPETPAP